MHCHSTDRISVLPFAVPTAHALLDDVAATAARLLLAGTGLGSCVHTLPFQCLISAVPWLGSGTVLVVPTAQASLAEVAATPNSWPGTRFAGTTVTRGAATARSGRPLEHYPRPG